MDFNWTCPFCNQVSRITDKNAKEETTHFGLKSTDGRHALVSKFIVCPNPKCKQFTLSVNLRRSTWYDFNQTYHLGSVIQHWQLVPSSNAKHFPDFIPKAILDDYCEACLIRNQSPKASATLARRCIQGMLRDFWEVKAGRLIDEINQIQEKVDPLTWTAIQAVRKVGNIGAHMEKDINLIVDVDPQEAELLVGLVETLLEDWYIAREKRESRLQQIVQLSKDKEIEKGDTKDAK